MRSIITLLQLYVYYTTQSMLWCKASEQYSTTAKWRYTTACYVKWAIHNICSQSMMLWCYASEQLLNHNKVASHNRVFETCMCKWSISHLMHTRFAQSMLWCCASANAQPQWSGNTLLCVKIASASDQSHNMREVYKGRLTPSPHSQWHKGSTHWRCLCCWHDCTRTWAIVLIAANLSV